MIVIFINYINYDILIIPKQTQKYKTNNPPKKKKIYPNKHHHPTHTQNIGLQLYQYWH